MILSTSDGASAGACDVCGAPADLLCARCRCAWYCGPKCQRGAWPTHKSACAKTASGVEAGAGGGNGDACAIGTDLSASATSEAVAARCGADGARTAACGGVGTIAEAASCGPACAVATAVAAEGACEAEGARGAGTAGGARSVSGDGVAAARRRRRQRRRRRRHRGPVCGDAALYLGGGGDARVGQAAGAGYGRASTRVGRAPRGRREQQPQAGRVSGDDACGGRNPAARARAQPGGSSGRDSERGVHFVCARGIRVGV
jgi:hypothetical protein